MYAMCLECTIQCTMQCTQYFTCVLKVYVQFQFSHYCLVTSDSLCRHVGTASTMYLRVYL